MQVERTHSTHRQTRSSPQPRPSSTPLAPLAADLALRVSSSSSLSPSPTTASHVNHNPEPKTKLEQCDEIMAVQALGQLKNSGHSSPVVVEDLDEGEEYYDSSNDIDSLSSGSLSTVSSRSTLLRKVKNHPFVNSAVRAYKSNKPAIKYGVEIVERATQPMVNMIEQTSLEWRRKRRLSKANKMFPDDAKVDVSFLPSSSSSSDYSSYSHLNPSFSSSSSSSNTKRQSLPSITEALAMGNMNWNELSLNMSIESKKRLQTCFQLLMLANKQLSSKVTHLQELIVKEQELISSKRDKQDDDEDNYVDDEEEIYHDASDELSSKYTKEIKQEIVGTVKKVVTFISKYAGNTLPEPARSTVRESLLRLPTQWATQASSSSRFTYNTNGKVLVLANESLEMVSSVMSVFDETLTKADLWVKQKQEKQLAKQAILNNRLKRQNNQIKDHSNKRRDEEEEDNDDDDDDNINNDNDIDQPAHKKSKTMNDELDPLTKAS